MSKEKQNSFQETIRIDCPMRHENGNCLAAGGFCTAVNTPICEALHNAYDTGKMHSMEEMKKHGYRKQSEGEWIKHPVSYECTACKEEFFVEGYAEDYDPITDWDLHFCPNCGAKMKGGAE
jgi:DNA-directed RNA polymerase subunit RPC12/RpoP